MADARVAETFTRLVDVMARLRRPGGCPWDAEQTPRTLWPHLLEETYEVLDAIEAGDPAELRDELGDLLLQVVFQAEIAAEQGQFDVADVAQAIVEKLVRRHPHVFGDVTVSGAAEVVRNWGRIKAEEHRAAGVEKDPFDSLPRALPALARAQKTGDRAAQLGLDWADAPAVLAKVREEVAELEGAVAAGDQALAGRELGDLLLALTSVGRHLHVSTEAALDEATRRFVGRARHAVASARARGATLPELTPEERDRLWEAAKRALSASPPRV
jgi:tetrapyrrole methylase family protein/MazG family protein